MATGEELPNWEGFTLQITREEMETLQNALSIYMTHEQELIRETGDAVITRNDVIGALGGEPEITPAEKEVLSVRIDELFIGAYLSASELRAALVEISGGDFSESGP